MSILEKRTWESRLFDIACASLLEAGETITAIVSVTADQGGLTFGTAVTNGVVATYPDGTEAPIGTVIQVLIGSGTIPTGVQKLYCTVRARFITSLSNRIEATVLLSLRDQIYSG